MTLMTGTVESQGDNSTDGQPATPPAQSAPTPSWRDTLPEEFKNDPTLANFKGVDDLAKSFIHAQKLIGKDKVVLPSPTATEEEKTAFYRKLGMPEPDKYTLEGLEDDEASGKLKELFVKNNILPAQAKEIMNFLASEYSETEEGTSEAYQAAIQEGIEDLRLEWGEGFNANLGKAKAVVDTFGDPELKSYLNETGLGNDPMLIRMFAKIGSQFGEDSFKGKPLQAVSKDDAQKQINAIFADKNHPALNGKDPRHNDAMMEMNKLFEIINT